MSKHFVLPKWNSPVWATFSFHIMITVYALIAPGFARKPTMLIVSVVTCALLDIILNFLRKGFWKIPITGIGSSLALFILFDSYSIPLYFILATITILGKHFITLNDKHIFNPTSLSLLVIAYAFSDMATLNAIRWEGKSYWCLIFLIGGLLVTYYAKRILIPLAYISCFFLFAFIESYFTTLKFSIIILPILGPALLYYIFFMLTDPQTTPVSNKDQILFGFLVSGIDTFLRFKQNRFSHLISLVIVSLIYSLYINFKQSTFRNSSEDKIVSITNNL